MSAEQTVVVVGASLAGLRACETLRSGGFRDRLVLIGAERHLPYDRPPLSKRVLSGEWTPEQITLRKPEAFAELGLDLELGVPAVGLDVDAREVHLADGRRAAYTTLVIATGCTARRLPSAMPGVDLDGVVTLRTLDDALALRDRFATARSVAIIGAGFIGSEVAATAHGRGLRVTVLEALDAPLVRGLGADLGRAVGRLHERNGISLRVGVSVEGFSGERHVEGVRLAGGEIVPADVVVVGIGAAPALGWLAGSGLTITDGVECDRTLRAAPAVFAAGDIARWDTGGGTTRRIEHWTNANEQGAHAANAVLAELAGADAPAFETVPFVWSEQYDTRIQIVGTVQPDDAVEVVSGSLDDPRWAAITLRDGRLAGAIGVDLPRVVMAFRRLLLAGATADEALAHASALQ